MNKVEILKSKQADHFLNQLKILKNLDHPFIVKFLGFEQDEKHLYLGLELVKNGDLFNYLRKYKVISLEHSK